MDAFHIGFYKCTHINTHTPQYVLVKDLAKIVTRMFIQMKFRLK